MKWQELQAQARTRMEEAQQLVAKAEGEGLSSEEKAALMEAIDAKIAEARDLKGQADRLKIILEVNAQLQSGEEQEAIDKAQKEADARGREFKTFGEFLIAVHNVVNPKVHQVDPRLEFFREEGGRVSAQDTKALAEGVGATGGFLVPTEFRAELLAVAAERAIVRPRATIIPMARRSIVIPTLDQTGTASGRSNFFGGVQVKWLEEAGQKDETSPEFRQKELTAHKMAAITYVTEELLADSAISLAAFLTGPMGLAGAVAWEEDYAFLRGTGAGQPLGVIVALVAGGLGPTLQVVRAAANAFGYVDAVNMMSVFLPGARGVWVMHQTVLAQLYQMVDPSGQYIWQPNAREGAPGTLLGYPVIFTEKLPVLGTAGDVLLADFDYYLLGDRQRTTIDSSIHNRYEYDQITWRVVHRVDGMPWMNAPITLADGATQVSPFIILGGVAAS